VCLYQAFSLIIWEFSIYVKWKFKRRPVFAHFRVLELKMWTKFHAELLVQAAPTSTFPHFSDLQVTSQAKRKDANEERRRTWWLFKMWLWFPSIKKVRSARVRCVVDTERLHVIVFARGTLSFYHKTHSGNTQKRARVVFATWQLPCCARSLFLSSADRSERRTDRPLFAFLRPTFAYFPFLTRKHTDTRSNCA